MPYRDRTKRNAASAKSKQRRRRSDPEAVRAADNERKRLKRAAARREREERTGQPARDRTQSLGRRRLVSLSLDKVQYAIDRVVALASPEGQIPWAKATRRSSPIPRIPFDGIGAVDFYQDDFDGLK